MISQQMKIFHANLTYRKNLLCLKKGIHTKIRSSKILSMTMFMRCRLAYDFYKVISLYLRRQLSLKWKVIMLDKIVDSTTDNFVSYVIYLRRVSQKRCKTRCLYWSVNIIGMNIAASWFDTTTAIIVEKAWRKELPSELMVTKKCPKCIFFYSDKLKTVHRLSRS